MAGALVLSAPLRAHAAGCIAGLPCVSAHSSGDNDSKSDSEACDADFMNQIYARAFLESEREVVAAGQGIRKPDSVLELTCFDAMAKAGLESYNPIFSATGTNAVDKTSGFNKVIKTPVADYINASFSQAYFMPGSGHNYAADTSPCTAIKTIQKLSRCADVDAIIQPFYDFTALASADPRKLPASGACSGTAITNDFIDVAGNEDDYKYVSFDLFDTYTDLTEGACSTLTPVGTGVQYDDAYPDLTWSALGEYIFGARKSVEQKICVNPACYYDLYTDKCLAK